MHNDDENLPLDIELGRDQNFEVDISLEKSFCDVFDRNVGMGYYPDGIVVRVPDLNGS
jgi:hypothetical protein